MSNTLLTRTLFVGAIALAMGAPLKADYVWSNDYESLISRDHVPLLLHSVAPERGGKQGEVWDIDYDSYVPAGMSRSAIPARAGDGDGTLRYSISYQMMVPNDFVQHVILCST